jgi:hypothetical protein
VRKVADQAFEAVDTVPPVLASRFLAVRASDAQHMMIDAEVCEGAQLPRCSSDSSATRKPATCKCPILGAAATRPS